MKFLSDYILDNRVNRLKLVIPSLAVYVNYVAQKLKSPCLISKLSPQKHELRSVPDSCERGEKTVTYSHTE